MTAMTPQEQQMQFVFNLRSGGVKDTHTLKAMEAIPRDLFVADTFLDRAFDDTALPIECGQTISAPSVVGQMTQALDVKARSKVLEIGAGSGYQAAVLSCLARRVYSLERHRPLAASATKAISTLGITNVVILRADGTKGFPEQAPFDRILVTAAAEDVPSPLISQLALDGVLVMPVGQHDQPQTLIKVIKTKQGLDYTELNQVRFVPLLEGMA